MILPGEMKTIFNRVTEAKKAAEAGGVAGQIRELALSYWALSGERAKPGREKLLVKDAC